MIYGVRVVKDDWFCTVFPNDPDEPPSDFDSYDDALEFALENYGEGNFTIESPC